MDEAAPPAARRAAQRAGAGGRRRTRRNGRRATGGVAAAGGASGGGGGSAGGRRQAAARRYRQRHLHRVKAASANATGSGPHRVIVETNADPGIKEGTIFRPMDLGGAEKYPIFVWGEGACSLNGLSNSAAMAEIASHGYFVVADGTPNGSGVIAP